MLQTYELSGFNWLDLKNPTAKEIVDLGKKYNLHILTARELTSKVHRPRVMAYENYLLLNLRLPLYHRDERRIGSAYVALVIGKNFLVTMRNGDVPALDDFVAKFDRSAETLEELLYTILDALLRYIDPIVDHLIEDVETLERKAFHGHGHNITTDIVNIERNVSNTYSTIHGNLAALQHLTSIGSKILPQAFLDSYIVEVTDDIEIFDDQLESQMRSIRMVRDANEQFIANGLSRFGLLATIFGAIFLPLNVMSEALSVYLAITPDSKDSVGLHILVGGLTLLIILGLLWYLRHRKLI